MPKSTIQDTVKNATQRDKGKSHQRTSRPKAYLERDERKVLRIIRPQPLMTYEELRKEVNLSLSRKQLRNILKAHGITNWLARKRPLLTAWVAKKRLKWAKKYQGTDWSLIIWSDECSVERGTGKNRQWAFGFPWQKYDRNKVNPYKKGKDISIMVWAAFPGALGRSDLVIMERDPEAKRNGYSANSHLQVLDEAMETIWIPDMFFM